MVRSAFSLLAVGVLAASALGQGFNSPPPLTPTPFTPRYMVPGVPGSYGLGIGVRIGPATVGFAGRMSFGGPMYNYGYGYGMPYYGVTSTPSLVLGYQPLEVPALQGAGTGQPAIILEVPAELTIEFPAQATATLDGVVMPGTEATRQWKSPPLKVGQHHTFTVTARWTVDGQKFEWDRVVTLGPGERGRITVARGFPIKD